VLVLTRNRDEEVVICDPDGTILGRVTVCKIKGDRVRLGFDFPRSFPVHRNEVYVAIVAKRESTEFPPPQQK